LSSLTGGSQRAQESGEAARGRRAGAPQPNKGDRYRATPLPPARGQEAFGSWANIIVTARADPLFGVLLGLISANVLLQLLGQSWLGTAVAGAILWGVVTFRWWGYVLGMFGAGIGVLLGLAFAIGARGEGSLSAIILVAINGFALVVLYTRRDRFD